MDLVSNFMGIISPNLFGGEVSGVTTKVDLEDNTFSDMLEKQIQKELELNKPDMANNFGWTSGIDIGDLDGTNPVFEVDKNLYNTVKPVKQINETSLNNMNDGKNISTSEVVTFFNSLFESKPTLTDTSRSGLFDFERKVAAGSYGKYAKNIVTDLQEFVTDGLKIS